MRLSSGGIAMLGAILLSSVLSLGSVGLGKNAPLDKVLYDENIRANLEKKPSSPEQSKYEQKNSPLAETKACLLEHGSTFKVVELSNADDELLQIVKDHCTSMTSFSFVSVDSHSVTTAGLESLSQAATLQATLTSLSVTAPEVVLSDSLVQNLVNFRSLTELSLSGKWKVKAKSVVALLQAKAGLKQLSLTGLRIKPLIANAIGNLTGLARLSLSNCLALGQKKSDDYTALLSKLTSLQEISLGRCEMFSYEHCKILAKLSLRRLSIAGSTWMFNEGLKILCDSKKLQKSLEFLDLTNAQSIDTLGFEPLKKLSLKTLRLQNCLWFNDTSLSLLMQGALTESLEALELERVYISDSHISLLSKCRKLHTLMVQDSLSCPM